MLKINKVVKKILIRSKFRKAVFSAIARLRKAVLQIQRLYKRAKLRALIA